MKKSFYLALAALGFAACEKGAENVVPEQKGEKEQSYVAITLAAGDLSTRAASDNYDDGLEAERAVKSAHVFFFKDGAAFPVTYEAEDSPNARGNNYLEVYLEGEDGDNKNVSDVKDAVLILENYKGEYPNEIVAVLNWYPTEVTYSYDELKDAISELGDDANGYVMSNAVFANANKETINAVNLTISNIGKTPEAALANPVVIHVERVAAKVVFTADNAGKFEVGEVTDSEV